MSNTIIVYSLNEYRVHAKLQVYIIFWKNMIPRLVRTKDLGKK